MPSHKTLLAAFAVGVAAATGLWYWDKRKHERILEEEKQQDAKLEAELLQTARGYELNGLSDEVIAICKRIVGQVNRNSFEAYVFLIRHANAIAQMEDFALKANNCASQPCEKRLIQVLKIMLTGAAADHVDPLLTELVARFPDFVPVLLLRTSNLINFHQDMSGARALCDRIIHSANSTHMDVANAWLHKALTHDLNTEFKSRIHCLDLAIHTFPNYCVAFYQKAEAYYLSKKDGNDVEALQNAQKCLNINPKNCPSLFLSGCVHLRRKELEEARGFFQQCIDLQWPNYLVYDGLCKVYMEQRELDNALKTITTASNKDLISVEEAAVIRALLCLLSLDFVRCKQYAIQMLLSTKLPNDSESVLKGRRLMIICDSVETLLKKYKSLDHFVRNNTPPYQSKFTMELLCPVQMVQKNPLEQSKEENIAWIAMIDFLVFLALAGTGDQYNICYIADEIITRLGHPKYVYVQYLSTNAFIASAFIEDLMTRENMPKLIRESFVRTLENFVKGCMEKGVDPRENFINYYLHDATHLEQANKAIPEIVDKKTILTQTEEQSANLKQVVAPASTIDSQQQIPTSEVQELLLQEVEPKNQETQAIVITDISHQENIPVELAQQSVSAPATPIEPPVRQEQQVIIASPNVDLLHPYDAGIMKQHHE